jgi:hypothetical protein
MQSDETEKISLKLLPNSTPILERAEEDEVTNKDERSQANITPINTSLDHPIVVANDKIPSKETIHWSEEMKSNLNDPINCSSLEKMKSNLNDNVISSSLENFVRHVKSEEVDIKHKNATRSVSNIHLV